MWAEKENIGRENAVKLVSAGSLWTQGGTLSLQETGSWLSLKFLFVQLHNILETKQQLSGDRLSALRM